MPRPITSRTTLANLKTEAKRWLRAWRAGAAEARERLARALPVVPPEPTLRDVQRALALEHGLPGWAALSDRLAGRATLQRYERVAEALATAYRTGDEPAMQIVWAYFGHRRTWDGMRRYVRLDLGRPEQPPAAGPDAIAPAEARVLVARAQGFESWEALTAFASAVDPGKTTIVTRSIAMYAAGGQDSRGVAARSRDWDDVIRTLSDRRFEGLQVAGQATDAVLARLARLDHLTTLDLEGSGALTDDGLRQLASLSRLRHLNLAGCGSITDRGLEVLARLPELVSVNLAWTRVTDAGLAALARSERLEALDLSGTQTGDAAIAAVAGKPRLGDFRSGQGVTDAGLALLHEIPVFKRWHGGEPRLSLTGFDAGPNFLMLRGTFTDAGLSRLVGLDGLFALNLDSDRFAITGAGLGPLADLPKLGWLAFDAKDESMAAIAALPHLRFLMCQDTTAGDDGFSALSRSRSIEYIWGRRCHRLQRRGFMALAGMPALRALSVSCRNVDDEGLSALPRFAALRELMPMDVPDQGYRHIGRCAGLESLVLMYCRDTTDAATGHLTELTRLSKYFASYNRITDRTPELLGRIGSLEEVVFDSCAGLTNAGVAALARLPRLRELGVSGMPGVTGEVAAAFGPGVTVRYNP